MRKHLFSKETGKKGFSLVELMVVVGIIAILCAIGIPSMVAINRHLKFNQRNDYAESLFMAAQANLTELRSNGGLRPLQAMPERTKTDLSVGAYKLPKGQSGFPDADWSDQYCYTVSGTEAYDFILPPGCIDEAVRDKYVLVEYNPISGNVYSVFYSEDPEFADMKGIYTGDPGAPYSELKREEADRKPLMLGYYHGSGLSKNPLTERKPDTEIKFENGQEGVVIVNVGIPSEYYENGEDNKGVFLKGLQVDLVLTGELTKKIKEAAPGAVVDESDYSIKIRLKNAENTEGALPGMTCDRDDGEHVKLTIPVDSLRDKCSFANRVFAEQRSAKGEVITNGMNRHMSELDEDKGEFIIYPGDNVTLTAECKFLNAYTQPAVKIRNGVLSNVNPLYAYMVPSVAEDGKFVVGVANGRNLQNLNIMHPSIAKMVSSIMITDDIDWSDTAAYYNSKYGKPVKVGDKETKLYQSDVTDNTAKAETESGTEAPGRKLPYFVPLQHADLFGAPDLHYAETLPEAAKDASGNILYAPEYPMVHGRDRNDNNMVGSPEPDAPKDQRPCVEISYLNIDTSKYGNGSEQAFYANSNPRYDYTGMIGYLNTRIDNVAIVNPKVSGSAGSKAATGALIGAAGTNAQIVSCSTYLNLDDHLKFEGVNAYGVNGRGAVGGLVGYAENNRVLPIDGKEIVGNLPHDLRYLTFSRSFAAIPVDGGLNDAGLKNVTNGFYEGVGGFVGVSRMANAYDCYSSSDVHADKVSIKWKGTATKDMDEINKSFPEMSYSQVDQLISLGYSGSYSAGAGGFVGTSHGTRYSNCFSTGITKTDAFAAEGKPHFSAKKNGAYENYADQAYGVGSFVGVMTYDGQVEGGHLADQWTIFDSCYSLGRAYAGKKPLLVFSGANARNEVSPVDLLWKQGPRQMYVGDYYRVLAPFKNAHPNEVLQPMYGVWYIYKNTYQYDHGEAGGNSSSNECADFLSYNEMQHLVVNHQYGENNLQNPQNNPYIKWRVGRIEAVKAYKYGPNGKTYGELYGNKFDKAYGLSLMEGFYADPWHEDIKASETHPYNILKKGKAYPFPKLMDIDYYGYWPEKPRSGGLAYYEVYDNAEFTDPYGIYFDREGADNHPLRNRGERDENDKTKILFPVAKEDGYVILTDATKSLGDKLKVKLNNTDLSETAKLIKNKDGNAAVYAPGGRYGTRTFNVYSLPMEEILKNMDPNVFYNKLTLSAGDNKVFYFNPKVALTQINPAGDSTTGVAVEPGSSKDAEPALPPQILIRSARQFNEISTMNTFWKTYRSLTPNYYQQLDIDGSRYKWNGEKATDTIFRTDLIGTDNDAFNANYTSSRASIRGLLPKNDTQYKNVGLFGTIGSQGKVQSVSVEVVAGGTCTVGNGTADNLGIVAGLNEGALMDVHVAMASNGKTAKTILYDDLAEDLEPDDDDGKWVTWWKNFVKEHDGMFDEDGDAKKIDEDVLKTILDHIQNQYEALPDDQVVDYEDDGSIDEDDTYYPKEKFDDEFGGKDKWGKDDGKYEFEEFEEIFEFIDEHNGLKTNPGAKIENLENDPGTVVIELRAKVNAGVLAGTSSSLVDSCGVAGSNGTTLKVYAQNTGSALGTAIGGANGKGGSVIFNDVYLRGDLLLTGNHGGGFAGAADNTSFDVNNVTLGKNNEDHFVTSNAEKTGGFAGKVTNASVNSTNVDLNASVTAKTSFGGLIGLADSVNSTKASVAFHKPVTAKQTAGLIDVAGENGPVNVKNANVAISDKFEGTGKYAAGVFGILHKGSSAEFTIADLERTGCVTSANNAAGFAAVTSGTISDAKVLMPSYDSSVHVKEDGTFMEPEVRISGSKMAAGFACTVNESSISRIFVSGRGMIISAEGPAAGFASIVSKNANITTVTVTPVRHSADITGKMPEYLGNKLDNLVVNGKTMAAGFANTVEAGAKIQITNVLCELTGSDQNNAGFANANYGEILTSMSNIKILGEGNIFANNMGEGTVTYCYAYFTDTELEDSKVKDPTQLTIPTAGQNYKGCFFADLKPIVKQASETDQHFDDNAVNVTVIYFDDTVETSARSKLIVYSKDFVKKLNGDKGHAWHVNSDDKFPFSHKLVSATYAYPMLRNHLGDFPEPPYPSYGVVYYEVFNYSDLVPVDNKKPEGPFKPKDPNANIYWIHIKDAVDMRDNAMEQNSLDFTAYFDRNGSLIPGTMGLGKPVMKGNGATTKIYAENHVDETPLGEMVSELSKITVDIDIYKADYCLFNKEIRVEEDIQFTAEDSNGKKLVAVKHNPKYPAPGETLCVLTDALKKIDLQRDGLTSENYRFYEMDDAMKNAGKVFIKGVHTKKPLEFNTWFADTLTKHANENEYEVRSAEQFQNLNKTAVGGIIPPKVEFDQSWDILNKYGNNNDFHTIPQFDGKYHGNDRQVVLSSNEHVWISLMKDDTDHKIENRIHNMNMKIGTVKVPIFDRMEDQLHFTSFVIDKVENKYTGNMENPYDPNITKDRIIEGSVIREISGCLSCDKMEINSLEGFFTSRISGGKQIFIPGPGGSSVELDPGVLTGLEVAEMKINKIVPNKKNDGGIVKTFTPGCAVRIDHLAMVEDVNFTLFPDVSGPVSIKNIDLEGNSNCSLFGKVTGTRFPYGQKGNLELGTVNVKGTMKAAMINTVTQNALIDRMTVQTPGWESLPSGTTLTAGAANIKTPKGPGGILINTIDGNSIVRNCHVKVPQVVFAGKGPFGSIAGTAAAGCDTSLNTADTPNVKVNGKGVFGGLIGNNKGKMFKNSVKPMNVSLFGMPDETTTAGGLVGVNEGILSENSVENVTVTYVQPANGGDTANIGGLVGVNNGGSIENTNNVSGKIILDKAKTATETVPETSAEAAEAETAAPSLRDLFRSPVLMSTKDVPAKAVKPDGKNRDYNIGGIVGAEGKDGESAYKNVTSSIVIDANWADSKEPSKTDTAGQGSVGMFIGSVYNGTFENCSSTVKDNPKFDFMGEIYAENKRTYSDTVSSDVKKDKEVLIGQLDEVNEGYQNADGQTYTEYLAKFDSCTFSKGGKTYKQSIEDKIHYYTESGAEQIKAYMPSGEQVLSVKTLNGVTLSEFAKSDTNGNYVLTPFFGLDDGEYVPLYVKVIAETKAVEPEESQKEENPDETEETEMMTQYTYQIGYVDPEDHELEIYGTMVTGDPDNAVFSAKNGKIYSIFLELENGPCLIRNNKNEMLTVSADGNKISWEKYAKTKKGVKDRMIWNASTRFMERGTVLDLNKSPMRASWLNGVQATNFLTADLDRTDSEELIALRIMKDGTLRLGNSERMITVTPLTMIAAMNLDYTNTFTYLGTAQVLDAVPADVPEQEENAENEEAAAPSETAKPEVESKPSETAKPEAESKPSETAKPEAESKPSETVKPDKEAKPSDTVKPAEESAKKEEAPVVNDGASPKDAA